MATFFDSFNRADSATTLGSPWQTIAPANATGTDSIWGMSLTSSVWGISSNRAYPAKTPLRSNGFDVGGYAYIATSDADGTIQATLAAAPGGSVTEFGLLAWRMNLASAGTTSISYYSATNKGVYYTVSGTATTLATFASGFVAGDVMTVTLSGTTATVKKNGNTVATVTGLTNNTTELNVGMTGHNLHTPDDGLRIDNFWWVPAPLVRGWVVGQIGWGGTTPDNFQVYQGGNLVFSTYVPPPFASGTNIGMAQSGDADSTHYVWDDFSSTVVGTSIADTFNRADNATSLGTASDGGSWTLTPRIQWGIASNRAYQSSDSSGILDRFGSTGYNGVYRDSGSIACDITATFGITSGSTVTAGILFAYDGGLGSSGWAFLVHFEDTTGSLIRLNNHGGDAQIGSTFTISDISTSTSTFRVVFTP